MLQNNRGTIFSFSVLTLLFFLWGFITVMNDILIPFLKEAFNLTHTEAMLIQSFFFGAYAFCSFVYFIISTQSGDPLNKIGYKNGLMIGLFISAAGLALFYPAAELRSYPFFLVALFILGFGFTILQITANPFVSILGDENSAASRLNLAQAFNSLGTFIAPLLGAYMIYTLFGSAEKGSADGVKIPYIILSGICVISLIIIYFTKFPDYRNSESVSKGTGALKYSHLLLGIVAIFCYVGAEVSIGSMMTGFLGLSESGGYSKEQAAGYVALYWGGLMIGRFVGAIALSDLTKSKKYICMILIPNLVYLFVLGGFHLKAYLDSLSGVVDYGLSNPWIYLVFISINFLSYFLSGFRPSLILGLFSVLIILLLSVSIVTTGTISIWCLVGTGLFNSIMWSNIFTLSIKGLGKFTGQGSSLLVMAILGGAVIPPIQGLLADSAGIKISFILPALCYIYLVYFALFTNKQRSV